MTKLTNDQIRQNVRGRYQKIAVRNVETSSPSRTSAVSSCCDSPSDFSAISAKLGYSSEDMTPEMISRARDNALKGKFSNTEFRLGEIEHLPVADNSINVIISNCVINLSPDKQQVFREAYRVLQPAGRLAISDIVTTAELPPEIKNDLDELYSGCISGASSIADLEFMLQESGFTEISIEPKGESKTFIKDWIPGSNVDQYIVSAVIKARK
ncbi:methyltransferase domain-containing protein [Paenibacillus sp. FSL P4-0338]|uniref:methyltransferase domain-containing protein n=1 Tax=unclassified Paenibacillus TaxID=185978 RepID=UPI0003E1FF70|nr:methyltransferase domain-containing protein [Paenibacillus sp. FSL R7-269]ETT46389.1 arsenite S-adenosylmethyltransferase [Paenibacillus sp. FSL R7-269]